MGIDDDAFRDSGRPSMTAEVERLGDLRSWLCRDWSAGYELQMAETGTATAALGGSRNVNARVPCRVYRYRGTKYLYHINP